ncbi:unnamed protein product, partial [Musa hybrid cultivar]
DVESEAKRRRAKALERGRERERERERGGGGGEPELHAPPAESRRRPLVFRAREEAGERIAAWLFLGVPVRNESFPRWLLLNGS